MVSWVSLVPCIRHFAFVVTGFVWGGWDVNGYFLMVPLFAHTLARVVDALCFVFVLFVGAVLQWIASSLFFGYTFVLTGSFFLLTGAVGYFSCQGFINVIYSSIKVCRSGSFIL